MKDLALLLWYLINLRFLILNPRNQIIHQQDFSPKHRQHAFIHKAGQFFLGRLSWVAAGISVAKQYWFIPRNVGFQNNVWMARIEQRSISAWTIVLQIHTGQQTGARRATMCAHRIMVLETQAISNQRIKMRSFNAWMSHGRKAISPQLISRNKKNIAYLLCHHRSSYRERFQKLL